MTTNTSNTSRHGFTLMELLLVVVISAILSAISIPLFVHSLEGNQLKTAARSINRMHRYARAMAVLKGSPMFFEYNPTNKLLTVSAGTNALPLITRELPEKINLKDFILLPDNNKLDEFPPVEYSTSGQCIDYAVTLTDTRDKRITIEVDGIAGSVRFEDE